MFNQIFGVPVLIAGLKTTDEQLSDMKSFMSKKQDLADGEGRLYTGDTSDVLLESQILSHPDFQCLQKPILKLAKVYLQNVTTTAPEFEPYIMKSWPVVVRQGGHVKEHSHSYAHLSAVYYLDDQEPDKEGELVFMRDTSHPLMNMGIKADYLDEDMSELYCGIKARKNKLVMFPSGVLHYVSTNLSKNTRYSVSCDIINTKVSGDTEGCILPPDRWIRGV